MSELPAISASLWATHLSLFLTSSLIQWPKSGNACNSVLSPQSPDLDPILPAEPLIFLHAKDENIIFWSRIQSRNVHFICHISLISLNLEQSVSISFSIMTLTFAKKTDRLFFFFFGRTCLNLGLCDVSLWLESCHMHFCMFFPHAIHGFCMFLKNHRSAVVSFSVHRIRRHVILVCPLLTIFLWSLG